MRKVMFNKKDIDKIALEQYRELRTNIKYSFTDNESKVILITSSMPNEGKSTVASELALTIASDSKKVLLMDCDLRKPTIHRKFKASNSFGLSELLIKEKNIKDVVQDYRGKLKIITSGNIPPNSCELLSSENMDNLLKELKKEYDYIILDSPPLISVSDSQILANKADGIFLVVREGKTTKNTIINAKKKINNGKGNLLGSIINRSNEKGNQYY